MMIPAPAVVGAAVLLEVVLLFVVANFSCTNGDCGVMTFLFVDIDVFPLFGCNNNFSSSSSGVGFANIFIVRSVALSCGRRRRDARVSETRDGATKPQRTHPYVTLERRNNEFVMYVFVCRRSCACLPPSIIPFAF